MAAIIIKLSQNEWVKFFVQMWELNLGMWVDWEEKLLWQSKMVEFLAEFKMAAMYQVSQMNEWSLSADGELILASVSEFERKNYYGWIQDGRITRWLPSSS